MSPQYSRRTVLRLGGAALGGSLAGCSTRSEAESPPTDSPVPTPTHEPTPTVRSSVDLPPCPETPDSYSRETVREFAWQFERSYVTRRTYLDQERVTSVFLHIDQESTDVSRTEDGWVVRFEVVGPAVRFRREGSTETAHVDPGLYTAQYYVTDTDVIRAKRAEKVDPREDGADVNCPPQ